MSDPNQPTPQAIHKQKFQGALAEIEMREYLIRFNKLHEKINQEEGKYRKILEEEEAKGRKVSHQELTDQNGNVIVVPKELSTILKIVK